MQITIGRERDARDNNRIVIPDPKISSRHLLVAPNEGSISIEDLDSSNGTFLNGKRIKRGIFYPGDALLLADVPVKYDWLTGEITKMRDSQRTDYTKEFKELKLVYNDYKRDYKALSDSYTLKNNLVRGAITIVVLFILYKIIPKDNNDLRSVAAVGGSTVTFGLLQLWQPFGHLDGQLNSIREAFLIRYRCPKCGLNFGDQMWTVLAAQKVCRSCKAVWVN